MTIQLKENAFYKRRDGKIRGPVVPNTGRYSPEYPWEIDGSKYTASGICWIGLGESMDWDLISEVNADGSPIQSQTYSQIEYELRCTRHGYDELHAYVIKLEPECQRLREDLASSEATHDKLRKDADFLVNENTRLQAELEALKPKPVVLSAWRNVYIHGTGDAHSSRASADGIGNKLGYVRLSVLRFDTVDGVTTAHLEEV